jgi:trans-2,3-dihydro-3-hydroxyanthranilate isomerase
MFYRKKCKNQLAVFLDAHSLSTEQMQLIAREINFAESTFITKLDGQSSALRFAYSRRT